MIHTLKIVKLVMNRNSVCDEIMKNQSQCHHSGDHNMLRFYICNQETAPLDTYVIC